MAECDWSNCVKNLAESFENTLKQLNFKDFVTFCVENKQTRIFAEDFLKNILKNKKLHHKNSAIALEKFKKGRKFTENVFYSSVNVEFEDLQRGLLCLSDSIRLAKQNDEFLPRAYLYRAFILEEINGNFRGIQDIEIALNINKTYDSEEICLKLKNLINELENFKKKNSLDEGILTVINYLIKKYTNYCLESKLFPNSTKNSKRKLPELSGGLNKEFPSASKYLKVCYNMKKGRHVIATQKIAQGDVLFVEKPFAFVTFEKVCSGCTRKIEAPIPCLHCVDVFYCSLNCRDKSWELNHSFECGNSDIFKTVGIAYLGIRVILSAASTLPKLKKVLSEIKELKYEEGIVTLGNNNYENMYNLVSNDMKYEKSDYFQYVMTALLLALYMKNHTKFFEIDSDEKDLKLVTSTILRHLLQLICNGHAIGASFDCLESKCTTMTTEKRIGTAIYPSISLMNHSCEPSIFTSFHNEYAVVRALKTIQEGEEVFNCYGPHYRRMRRSKRQEILRTQYFFKCECQPCLQPIDVQEKFIAFKCEKCKGAFSPKEENSSYLVCQNCGIIGELSDELIEKQLLFSSLMNEGDVLFEKDVNLALKKFLSSWLLGREIFYKFNKELCFAADQVARCFSEINEFEKAVKFLNCCVISVKERFGFDSIEHAIEMYKLGVALYCLSLMVGYDKKIVTQGVYNLETAMAIFGTLYGPDNIYADDILNKLQIFKTD